MFQPRTISVMATRPLPPLLPLPNTPPLCGRYQLQAQIGQGKTGIVMRALDLASGQPCAIKLLQASCLGEPLRRQEFENEARMLGRHPHPGIVAVRCFDIEEEGRPFIVMELLTGQDLAAYLRQKRHLPVSEVCGIMKQAADALHHLHQHGVVHRDVSPSNLFFCLESQSAKGQTEPCIKLLDFGMARTIPAESELADNHSFQETLLCDQVGKPAGTGADLLDLAAVGYELLCGVAPFAGSEPRLGGQSMGKYVPAPLHVLRDDIPEGLAQLFQLALGPTGHQHFPSTVDFSRALMEESRRRRPDQESSSNIQVCLQPARIRPPTGPLQPLTLTQLERIDRGQGQTIQMEAPLLEQLRICSERSGRQTSTTREPMPSAPIEEPLIRSAGVIGLIAAPIGLLIGMLLTYLMFHPGSPAHHSRPPISPDFTGPREMLANRSPLSATQVTSRGQPGGATTEPSVESALIARKPREVPLPLRLAYDSDLLAQ